MYKQDKESCMPAGISVLGLEKKISEPIGQEDFEKWVTDTLTRHFSRFPNDKFDQSLGKIGTPHQVHPLAL